MFRQQLRKAAGDGSGSAGHLADSPKGQSSPRAGVGAIPKNSVSSIMRDEETAFQISLKDLRQNQINYYRDMD